MALAATAVEALAGHKTQLTPGVWARVGQGPLFGQVLPIQVFLFGGYGLVAPTATVDIYSAAPPFYQRYKATATSTIYTGAAASPYVEFWVLVSVPCYVQVILY